MNKEEQLKSLSETYIVPSLDGVKKFEHHKMSIKRNSVISKKPSLPVIKNPKVSHELLLYPSLKTSAKILKRNRWTYKEMMNELNRLEAESVRNSYRLVMEHKSKLEYYKIRCKQVNLDNRNSSFLIFRTKA